MKSLRLTGRPDQEFVPEVFRLVADSRHVREAKLVRQAMRGLSEAR